jgi:G3E family GTPase
LLYVAGTAGCICCTLRPDFVAQLADLAASKPKFDVLIVEASGISEPQQVAEAFDLPTEGAHSPDDQHVHHGKEEEDAEALAKAAALASAAAKLRRHAYLDCTVTVIDAWQFPGDALRSRDRLADRGQTAGEEDDRTVSDLLLQQVEFANILIVNKLDLLQDAISVNKLIALLKALNPLAKILPAVHSAVSPTDLLQCHMFDMESARTSQGWLQSLAGKHVPESEEYHIRHIVFRARRPFHPARLHALLFGQRGPIVKLGKTITVPEPSSSHPLAGVVRSKGGLWLASTLGVMQAVHLGQAGRAWTFEPGVLWSATLAAALKHGRELEDEDAQQLQQEQAAEYWDPTPNVGDRRTELVFIGMGMNGDALLAALSDTLLTAAEWDVYQAEAMQLEAGFATQHEEVERTAALDNSDWLGSWELEDDEEEDDEDEEEEDGEEDDEDEEEEDGEEDDEDEEEEDGEEDRDASSKS